MKVRARWLGDILVSAGLAVLVLGPLLLSRGFVLRADMVFVPDMPWKAAWLGLDGRAPRFVPGDAFVWLLGLALPGDLVQKLLLFGAIFGGGLGAARLAAKWPLVARAAAATFFVWNPWVYERLAIGQWGIVVGYALLPWIALAAARLRDHHPGAWAPLFLWLAVAAVFSPASGLVALAVAAGVSAPGGRRPLITTCVAGVVANLPWLAPALLYAGSVQPATEQFTAFRPQPESGLGVLASVLSFGGIWKHSVVPPERTDPILVALSCVTVVVAVLGLRRAVAADRRMMTGLGVVGAACALLVLVTAVAPLAGALDDLSTHVPALGLFRDAHRYLGPFVLSLVPGIAAATAWLVEQARRGRGGLHAVALLVVAAPVLALPSLAWGLHGDFYPVTYPREWTAVSAQVPAGRVVVLPWRGSYRGFAWNDRIAVLDPATRFLPGEVLVDDRVFLDDRTLGSESRLLRAVGAALASPNPSSSLRRLGVASVLVEKGNGAGRVDLEGETLHDGPGLRLTALGATPSAADPRSRPSTSRSSPVRSITIVTLDGLVAAACVLAAVRVSRRSPRQACRVP